MLRLYEPPTHGMLIQNLTTKESDTKYCSFMSDMRLEELFFFIKTTFYILEEEYHSRDIIFINEKKLPHTHLVVISDKQVKGKSNSKSFRVLVENYSSDELMEKILYHIKEKIKKGNMEK